MHSAPAVGHAVVQPGAPRFRSLYAYEYELVVLRSTSTRTSRSTTGVLATGSEWVGEYSCTCTYTCMSTEYVLEYLLRSYE